MCGIWAFLESTTKHNKKKEDGLEEKQVESLVQDFFQLKHRGPDYSRFDTIGPLQFGFHRLSIVDTSFFANQPFKREDDLRTVYLLCNGEIYNYRELIEKWDLDTTIDSDCEILIDYYYKSIDKSINTQYHLPLSSWVDTEVKGEFAFILIEFDKLKNVSKIIACRDRIGIRPLYVSTLESIRNGHGLLLTSEIKGALSYSGDIEEFTPGSMKTYTVDLCGTIRCESDQRFSSLKMSTYDISQDDRFVHLRNVIVESVKRRLSADRPLAFLTSGGIDSSLVTAISAKLLGKPIRTFCCGITEGGVPVGRDLEYAREVAEWIGSEHTEVLFTKEEALAAIPDVIRTVESWDTTTIRASVGQYLVCKWIGQHTDCRVVLVGEGPDEVCSSYLFNWYAPSPEALHQSAEDYVKNIHLYDARRADRCIARWGLEARVPFLDPEFIRAYWEIPAKERMPKTHGIEKWFLREAFKDTEILPERVRMRMKDAFSDSISGQVSWTQIIQEWVADKVSDEEMEKKEETYPWCTPQTKEAYYYRKLFCEIHGKQRQTILPGYWQPRWNSDGIEVNGYVDPSARTLSVYSTLTQS